MSFAVTAVVATVATTAYSIYNGQQQAKAQAKAAQQAQANADRQAALADQQFNSANQKKPNVAGLLAANSGGGGGPGAGGGTPGVAGTMLTGPAGVDLGTLNLGKSTLLGQ